jgi:small subunit ribosomal protein S16
MVVLRLKKMGRAHHPFFRLAAMDKRAPRDGVVIEELGWYEPQGKEGKQFHLKMERIQHWLSVGAQPSDTAVSLIRRAGGSVKDTVLSVRHAKGRTKADAIRAKKGLEPLRGPKPAAEAKKG